MIKKLKWQGFGSKEDPLAAFSPWRFYYVYRPADIWVAEFNTGHATYRLDLKEDAGAPDAMRACEEDHVEQVKFLLAELLDLAELRADAEREWDYAQATEFYKGHALGYANHARNMLQELT